MEAQIDLANAGLAVPLKIFTKVARVAGTKKSTDAGGKAMQTLAAEELGASEIKPKPALLPSPMRTGNRLAPALRLDFTKP